MDHFLTKNQINISIEQPAKVQRMCGFPQLSTTFGSSKKIAALVRNN